MTTPKSTVWTGKAGDGAWGSSRNWSAGLPGTTTHVLFHGATSDAVALGLSPITVTSLAVDTASVTLSAGLLTLAPAPIKHGLPIALAVGGGGTLTLAASAKVSATAAQVQLSDATGAGTLVLGGALSDAWGIVYGQSVATVAGSHGHWSNSDLLIIEAGTAAQPGLLVRSGGTVDGGASGDAETVIIGNGADKGVAVVRDAHSLLAAYDVSVGTGYSGTLTIAHGAHVTDISGACGGNGDGFVTVTGAGSQWINAGGLQVGSYAPAASLLTVRDHGLVSTSDLTVAGTLALDSTATLTVTDGIQTQGGSLIALNTPGVSNGVVTLSGPLGIGGNPTAPFEEETTYLSAQSHAELALTGPVTATDPYAVLQIGQGHVLLSNTADLLPSIKIYGGALELGATGADGGARIELLSGGKHPTLTLDAGVALAGTITAFGANGTIDLAGILRADLVPGWTGNASGGTLTLADGMHSVALKFAGSFNLSSFAFGHDSGGGTLVMLAHH